MQSERREDDKTQFARWVQQAGEIQVLRTKAKLLGWRSHFDDQLVMSQAKNIQTAKGQAKRQGQEQAADHLSQEQAQRKGDKA